MPIYPTRATILCLLVMLPLTRMAMSIWHMVEHSPGYVSSPSGDVARKQQIDVENSNLVASSMRLTPDVSPLDLIGRM